ncbi:MAG: YraN family protein [Holophaga sp.]|nr:YraN family protein [Holophaga sp.]
MSLPNRTLSQRGRRARATGRLAERATLWVMWLRGWDVVAHNLKMGRFELDLLLTRGAELRLIEVKARRPGAWTTADIALSYEQRLRLQLALRTYLDRVPWPGNITFQRVSWAGRRVRFQPWESWDALKIQR